ncbi:hypothetical protein V6N12_011512 [Hibiscus sabdariffa]|uniref:Apple domain-containing protein n=1 Tax=Hibiscus sabdariffa TaxID=183260 RepID=A0ABR2AHF1_9ROSI
MECCICSTAKRMRQLQEMRCQWYFQPESSKQQHMGSHSGSRRCVRKGLSDCHDGEKLLKLAGIKLPDLIDFSLNETTSLKDCKVNCFKNCSSELVE